MHVEVTISAPQEELAHEICEALVEQRLVAGGMISRGPSHYWWEEARHANHYWSIRAYTLEQHKDAIIEIVEDMHTDEVPIVAFSAIDGNQRFLNWIEDCVQD